ncbi:NADH-dependent phenylglyoxylate dehydrogenase subunit alpha [Clostridium tepidiprofundi DSM 19306]|uniref:NADH-dependent phenylglyoxylate dehydrogenase subunit alpha n=1 Tax=Clostridium tepidiprofundi DSM 19306 TaxID=1121338 RepID=A0A151B3V6_9CLOT|nr:pyruvate ferredoxin oxidoreductase [Clostridium tepidiprofundi]KYH34599.1 NADH-dependent phenylglyoxylate dehydrogenase subunit alpha [Clostridium tepidiprofundi DSM 19306]
MANKKLFISGDDAVAEGARLARPHVISAYPITPQTVVVERLSEFVEDGSLDAEYIHVESEHSALSAAMGASSVGARAFTATSSQGLLYMAEVLPYTSGARLPVVMMNANRALATPWNIYGDQTDSLMLLNSGWIQVYVEDAQEALDMIIQAYKIAEDENVLMPMMVNLDGFVLTHTYELVEIPEQEKVDEFLPPFKTDNKMDLDNPKSLCITAGNNWNLEFKIKQELDMRKSVEVIERVDKEYGDMFGRYYGGMVDKYRCDDAEYVLVTVGSVTGTARIVVDKMRDMGHKVGVLKLRYLRPFPREVVAEVGSEVKAIGVIDKDISYGYEGTIFTNVNSALVELKELPKTMNFIAGLGGRDITKENVENMFIKLMEIVDGKEHDRIQFVNVRCE